MNVKTAIQIAKDYVNNIFGEEGAYNIGLEEVTFDGEDRVWEVTIGFSRPWDRPAAQNALLPPNPLTRTYKIVEISDTTHEVVAVRNRRQAAAA